MEIIKGYPFRGFKRLELEFDICESKLWNQFFPFSWKSDNDENESLNYYTTYKNY